MDIYGNVYSAYTPLVDGVDGWGNWIICCKADNLVHPLGHLPPTDPIKSFSRTTNNSATTPPSSSDEDPSEKTHSWYAIDGVGDIKQLIRWIRYRAEKTWADVQGGTFESPVKRKGKPPKNDFKIFVDRVSGVHGGANAGWSPREVVTKESIERLCEKLDTMGRMLGAFEQAKMLRKASGLL